MVNILILKNHQAVNYFKQLLKFVDFLAKLFQSFILNICIIIQHNKKGLENYF